MNNNAIQVIVPYEWNGAWVFDDPAVGLSREPFVCGIDDMIDRLTANIPDAKSGFLLFFSPDPFPGHQLELAWVRSEQGGNWYVDPEGNEGWLCPALFHYFDVEPLRLFAKASPVSKPNPNPNPNPKQEAA